MTKTLALKKIMRLNIELEKVEGFSAMMIVDDMKIVLQEYSDQQNKALIKEVEGLKEKLMQSSIDYDVMEIANESLHEQLEESKKENERFDEYIDYYKNSTETTPHSFEVWKENY